jgi:hypothetical protein
MISLLLILPCVSSFASFVTGPSPSMISSSLSRRRHNRNNDNSLCASQYNTIPNCKLISLRRPLYLGADDNDGSTNEQNNNDSAGDIIGGKLVTSLARLDKEWKLARQSGSGKKIGDWIILNIMDKDSKNNDDGDDDTTTSTPEIVYLLEPSSGSTPSCIIFFLGGAVLGQFPHIAYSTFCQKLATKMNAAIVAIPYEVGLDHFSIAQQAVKRMKNALIECEDSRGYPAMLPKYAIGHSLGAKLHSIGIAATGIGDELSGVGFVAYNNFGFAETITMARSFMKELQQQPPQQPMQATPFDALFDLAGMAVSAVGLEFTPSPTDMDMILRSKLDDEVLKKIRLFRFEDDDLDSTNRFIGCFNDKDLMPPSVSNLPGTHLTVSTVGVLCDWLLSKIFGANDTRNNARFILACISQAWLERPTR